MNGRGQEISMANLVKETISYQAHYGLKGGSKRGRGGGGECHGGASPGEGRRWGGEWW